MSTGPGRRVLLDTTGQNGTSMSNVGWTVGLASLAAVGAGTAGYGLAKGRAEDDTMLKSLPTMQEIADAAVFLASDLARSITGTTLDITVGTTAALNYKMPSIAFVKRQPGELA